MLATLLLAGCLLVGCIGSSGPLLGITSPDAIDSRYLKLRNGSRGYVVIRVTAPGVEPLMTPVLPPGAEEVHELAGRFGTLCPASLRVEIAAYARANPRVSSLQDETVLDRPYASLAIDLLPGQQYGCTVDPSWVDLDNTIECLVREVDEAAGAIGFQVGWVAPRRHVGNDLANPPPPIAPVLFPLNGRVVNINAQPIANLEIRLPQLDASVFTDARGRFSVLRPAGVYLLEPVLDGIEISPAVRVFAHLGSDEVPIEFIAMTDTIPASPQTGGTP
jgi:hypothetical protein